MKILIAAFIILLIYAKSQAQVITDTSRFGVVGHGHLRRLIDDFKQNCLNRGNQYSLKNVALSNEFTILYLNRALETSIFNKYSFLEKSSSEIISDDKSNGVSWVMVEIGFRSKKNMGRAINIIKSRTNGAFLMEALTTFVLLKEQDTIILVYSEYPDANIMACFFKRLKMMKGLYVHVRRD